MSAGTSETSVEAYMIARMIPATTATLWRFSFHSISCHCEAR